MKIGLTDIKSDFTYEDSLVLYEEAKRYSDSNPSILSESEKKKRTMEIKIARAYCMRMLEKYSEGKILSKKHLKRIREKKEPDPPDTLTIIKDLSIAYSIEKKKGKLQEMKTLEKEIQEKFDIKRQTNPIVAFKMTNLAGRYQAEGNYQEAEKLYKEALKIQKEKWDKDHPSLLSAINFVAGVYKDQGKYQKTEGLYKEILDKRKTVSGKEHSNTLNYSHR